MADLNLYIERVLEEEDKVLLSEASACVEAGALRAAYLTIWLATAESLRRKFMKAAAYDHEAAHIKGEIERMEREHKAVDAFLIRKAGEYGLVSDAEAGRLQHMYENRNVFGHPYEQAPLEQLVETAASEAVNSVLGQPLAFRHGYLSRLVTRLTTDIPFLNDDQNSVEEFARSTYTRSAADVRIWFVQKLVAALEPSFNDPSQDLLQRRGLWFLRGFLLAGPEVLEGWEVTNDLPEQRQVLPLLLADIDLFPHLSDHAKDIVVNTLLQEFPSTPPLLRRVYLLDEAGVLRPENKQALEQAIADAEVSRLRIAEVPLSAYWHRIVDLLETHSWNPQNRGIGALSSAGPEEVARLDDAAQEELGRNVFQAAEGSAFSAINLLGSIAANGGWPSAFIRGIALEPFVNEQGDLRLKPERLVSALRVIFQLAEAEQNLLIDEIVTTLQTKTPTDPFWFRNAAREVVPKLQESANQPDRQQLSDVADAIEAAMDALPEAD